LAQSLAPEAELVNAEKVVMLRAVEVVTGPSSASLPSARIEHRMTSSPTEPVPPAVTERMDSPRAIFDAAVAVHRAELLQYLQKRLRDPEVAADLAQETYTRMMKYRDVDHIEDFRLMQFRIANNLIFEYHRTRQRHHTDEHYSLDDTGPIRSVEPPVEAIIDARQAVNTLLKRTITQLPPKCRLAFMLSRFDGMSYPQIAERMDISVKMVEKHITKALLACRAAVGDRDF
jgi:RNA polymerase sigma-70 factor (ECF subfamily)